MTPETRSLQKGYYWNSLEFRYPSNCPTISTRLMNYIMSDRNKWTISVPADTGHGHETQQFTGWGIRYQMRNQEITLIGALTTWCRRWKWCDGIFAIFCALDVFVPSGDGRMVGRGWMAGLGWSVDSIRVSGGCQVECFNFYKDWDGWGILELY